MRFWHFAAAYAFMAMWIAAAATEAWIIGTWITMSAFAVIVGVASYHNEPK